MVTVTIANGVGLYEPRLITGFLLLFFAPLLLAYCLAKMGERRWKPAYWASALVVPVLTAGFAGLVLGLYGDTMQGVFREQYGMIMATSLVAALNLACALAVWKPIFEYRRGEPFPWIRLMIGILWGLMWLQGTF